MTRSKRLRALLVILSLGLAVCIWELGSTGLVDETPPLFAAASRAMSSTGDWLTPRVNGLPRFDKPPLVYWLMGLFYAIPGGDLWDPLGTWSARLPSGIASLLMMLALGDTVLCWPQKADLFPRRTAIAVALLFGLSPLVMLWTRTAVSDSLLCMTLGVSLLSQWRRYVSPSTYPWWPAWLFLGLAVLTKGPVAVVLSGLILALFACAQRDFVGLWQRLRPLSGLSLAGLISLPWYFAELIIEGKPFWDSFFGYHNLQRFTSVVNSHLQPWWFFGPVMIIASLPFTPLLILGLYQTLLSFKSKQDISQSTDGESLSSFATCWLIAVLIFFTFAATKLPSYWLPATPAAALLIGLTGAKGSEQAREKTLIFWAWTGSVFLMIVLAIALWMSPFWIPLIYDPEMPTLASELIESRLVLRGAFFLSISSFVGILIGFKNRSDRLLAVQVPLIAFHLFTFLPVSRLADKLRHLPVRQAAELLLQAKQPTEPVAMVGVMKPSLHFYLNQVVFYEGRSRQALVNLDERLREDLRDGLALPELRKARGIKTVLLLIDHGTANRSYWKGFDPEEIGEFSIYKIWRINTTDLMYRARELRATGINPDWKLPRSERY